ncbi:MAG: hypothetical protein QCI82_11250 [Candidatus Thermoplasmatota archaeon]|nr:hypothetical protein [Candidatus Thermoplasmatota archaeon]
MAEFYDVQSDPSEEDTDHDGVLDNVEYDEGTLPNASDSDRDGISDAIEIAGATNPKDCDTDQDNIPDGWVDGWWFDTQEKKWFLNSSRVNQSREFWEGEDRNCDGTWDKEINETDPTNPDSDGDGLIEPFEYFFNLLYRWTNPENEVNVDNDKYINPLDTDSDNDGLLDGEEDASHDGMIWAELGEPEFPGDNEHYARAWETNPYCADSDGDGIPDGLDCPDNGTVGRQLIFWKADTDQDGLINAMDRNSDNDDYDDDSDQYPLDPFNMGDTNNNGNPDDDGDGILDCNEDTTAPWGVYNEGDASNLSSADTDGDGLNDSAELFYGTNLTDPDTDGDGLNDYLEVMVKNTNPRVNDTDNDGILDGIEVSWGTNPLSRDSDGDGLWDNHEKERDLDSDGDGIINALDTDSDNDGLTDEEEEFVYRTDSTNADTDGDGLSDGFEINVFRSNPLLTNTDGNDHLRTRSNPDSDGLLDGEELQSGTDPNNPDSDGDGVLDGIDIEPMVRSLSLQLNIYEINALEELDWILSPTPEFRLTVTFEQLVSWKWEKLLNEGEHRKYFEGYNIQDDNTFKTDSINAHALWIKIHIVLDEVDLLEGFYYDDTDRCDISPQKEETSLTLYYDLRTSLWNDLGLFRHAEDNNIPSGFDLFKITGDYKIFMKEGSIVNTSVQDRVFDEDDAGYVTGKHDEKHDDNCDMSFGIGLNDFDNDNLTDWSERVYWGTKRNATNVTEHPWDSDGDGMSDGWEVVHNRDPLSAANGGPIRNDTNDPDEDGISDWHEYDLEKYGAHPNNKDIFVEVDRMVKEVYGIEESPFQSSMIAPSYHHVEFNISTKTVFLLIKSFCKEKYSLHIDIGGMGGGTRIKYQKINYIGLEPLYGNNNDIYDIKWGNNWSISYKEYTDSTYNIYTWYQGDNPQFNFSRFRIFYYCVIDEQLETDDNSIQNIIFRTHLGMPVKNNYETFCISRGHPLLNNGITEDLNVGGVFMHELGHCLGLDRDNEGFHGYDENGSKTCMNYKYILNTIDYSCQEWNEINLLTKSDYTIVRF